MNELQVMPYPKQDIKFWLDALSNPNVDRESKELLNQCLLAELKNYLYPIYKIKTDPMPIEKIYGTDTDTLLFKKEE